MPVPIQTAQEKQTSAKEKVYQQVARWIIDGTMVPGEKLNEGEIAAYFQVSRTPVHEALMLLAEHHFVEVLPSRGSFVSRLSLETADGVYEALSTLNGALSALACEKRTEKDLERLRDLNRRFDEAQRRGDIEQVLALDNAFHLGVAQVAGNPYLYKYLQQMQLHMDRYEHIFARVTPDRSLSTQDHSQIIDAIRDRDQTAARALTEANWMGVYTAQRDLMVEYIAEQA